MKILKKFPISNDMKKVRNAPTYAKNKKSKKFAMILLAVVTSLSLTACSGNANVSDNSDSTNTSADETDYSNQTLTGQVTSIEGTTVTLQLGELSTPEMPDGKMPDGEMPDGEMPDKEMPDDRQGGGQNGQPGDGETPPEIPDGEMPDGEMPNGEMPDKEMPDDEMPSNRQGGGQNGQPGDGETPPEIPDGEGQDAQPSGDQNGQPGGDQNGQPDGDQNAQPGDGQNAPSPMEMNIFTAGDETITLDLADASVSVENGTETTEGSIDDITVDSILVITFGDDNTVTNVTVISADAQGGMPGGFGNGGGGFGGSSEVTQGSSANTLDTDGEYAGVTYSSTGDDENALRIDGATVSLTDITVEKTAGSSSNTENGDFYGMNAALLATNGANVTIEGAKINSSAQNGNGVFSYGEGTTITISDSVITTTADNSGGIQTTGGGTTNASDLMIETSGNSSAAIRSDRGGGTVNVDGGSYTSNGYNSPAVYSTADITIKNATLTANNSEALVIEGKNSIILENCDVTGNMSDTQGTSSDENVHNVMIYQSMSGDADVGTSTFSMTGGTLTSNNGDLIYVTNTHCILTLSGVEILNKESDGYLLNVTGNSASRGWGTAGANGAQVEFTADNQTLEGDIVVDTISTLDMTLSDSSRFTGTINIVDNAQNGTAVENNAVVTIEAGSTWTLTGNCTLTSLENNGTIDFNGYTITLADGTVLK